MSDVERQLALEHQAVLDGAAEYHAAAESRAFKDSLPAHKLVAAIGADLAAAIASFVESPQAGAMRPPWPMLLRPPTKDSYGCKPEIWAAITLQAVLGHPELHRGIPITGLAIDLSNRVRDELRFQLWLDTGTGRLDAMGEEITGRERDGLFKRLESAGQGSAARRRKRAIRQAGDLDLGDRKLTGLRVKLGSGLVDLLVSVASDVFQFESGLRKTLTLTPAARTWVREVVDAAAMSSPKFKPMVAPPRRWTTEDKEG